MRFVLLEHDHPSRHWDLMLDTGTALRTWRLSRPPDDVGPIAVTPLGDHRRSYLDYEGPVSGGRGSVTRWDAGTYANYSDDGTEIRVDLAGQRVDGFLRLWREAGGSWSGEYVPAVG